MFLGGAMFLGRAMRLNRCRLGRPEAFQAAALIALLTLSACANLSTATRLAQLPLPVARQLSCCWQAEEKVEITAPDRTLSLTAAVAVRDGTLTVVVFDPLGRRMATLVHSDGEPQTLSAPPGWPAELSRQMLIGLYLHHLAPQQWGFSGNEGWSIASDTSHKALSYRQRELVRLDYAMDNPAERTLRFSDQNMSVRVTTLSRAEL